MAARVQIVVETKDASSGVLRAITGQLGAFGGLMEELTAKNVNWGNVSERATTLVIDGVKKAIETTQAYAEDVRDLALAGDMSAESASRMLQVLDDYQLTAEDAKAATKALTREGLAPSIETIAQISGEYLKLNDVEDRNALVQKKLGRASQEWLNLLNQGPDKIRAMNEAVNESLILSEQDVKAIEQYRMQLDQLSDTWQGVQIQIGKDVIPTLTDLLDIVNQNAEAGRNWRTAVEFLSATSGGFTLLIKDMIDAHKGNTAALEAESVATKGLAADSEELAREADILKFALAGGLQQAETDQADKLRKLQLEAAELRAKMDALTISGEGTEEEFTKLNQELIANKKSQEELGKATDKTIAKLIYQQAAATLDAQGQLELARKLGLISEEDYKLAVSIDNLTAKYDTNRDGIVSGTEATEEYIDALKRLKDAANALPKNVTTNVVTNFVTTGSAPTPIAGGTLPGNCFIEGTQIHINGKETKPIQDIRVGDMVLAYDIEKGELIPAEVEQVFHHSPSEMRSWCYLLINENLGATPEHPFYANGKWIPAGSLHIGDELLGLDGKPVIVTRIRAIYRRVWTYNLHVKHEAHNYFANGVLVHNKQQGGTVYAGVPQVVGEAGAEPFVPSVNGRVLGHAESLHAMSLAGGNNYFYGNVTISPDSEGGGDLLSIR